jgi:hypothetical protein
MSGQGACALLLEALCKHSRHSIFEANALAVVERKQGTPAEVNRKKRRLSCNASYKSL